MAAITMAKVNNATLYKWEAMAAVTELIDLQQIMEGLLFDAEVEAGPDIYNNGPVGKVA